VADRHAPERLVALLPRGVPVHLLPVGAEQPAEGVVWRQRDADAVAALLGHRVRVDEVVAMYEVHGDLTPLLAAHYIPPTPERPCAGARTAAARNARAATPVGARTERDCYVDCPLHVAVAPASDIASFTHVEVSWPGSAGHGSAVRFRAMRERCLGAASGRARGGSYRLRSPAPSRSAQPSRRRVMSR